MDSIAAAEEEIVALIEEFNRLFHVLIAFEVYSCVLSFYVCSLKNNEFGKLYLGCCKISMVGLLLLASHLLVFKSNCIQS